MGVHSVIPIITRETRLEGIKQRWGTPGAALFRFRQAMVQHKAAMLAERAAGQTDASLPTTSSLLAEERALRKVAIDADLEFAEFEREDESYRSVLDEIERELSRLAPVIFIGRQYLPSYDFRAAPVVVVVGQDGLVANAAKYVGDSRIVAVNPDPSKFAGVLLPFRSRQAKGATERALAGRARVRDITLAEVTLDDGQRLLAFNDLFIGCAGHASARYVLRWGNQSEAQSSSGVLVSTGAGSTGWLSSVFNMHDGVSHLLGHNSACQPLRLEWEDPRLVWVVREPFRAKDSGVSRVAGILEDGGELTIESQMPSRGVIFSDGIEADFLEFNTGSIARIRRSGQCARLVVG